MTDPRAQTGQPRVARAAVFLLSLLLLLATGTDALAANERLYSALYPYYVEVCALSQLSKKPGFGADTSGGPGGHSVLYLNGVCRDRSSDYPVIALCNQDVPGDEQGVGLSVNAHYKNANWLAVDGRDFFYRGNLGPKERLTREAYDRTQAEAKAKGVLNGIVFHDEVFDDMPAGADRHDYMYEVSIATDYAVAFGRDRYCGRLPVSRDQMGKVVDYLNGVNALYRDGKTEFVWNVFLNNCSHLTHNALAAAGLWDIWETERPIEISLFDFPVPKNEFVNMMRRTNDLPLDDLGKLYDDPLVRRGVIDAGFLPTEPGALADVESVVPDNDVYNTDVSLIFYDERFVFNRYQHRLDQILSQPRYYDFYGNLKYFAGLYRKLKAERKPLSAYLTGSAQGLAEPAEFRRFYERFYGVIDAQSAKIDSALADFSARLRYRDQGTSPPAG